MSATDPASSVVRRLPVGRLFFTVPLIAIALGAAVLGARSHTPDDQIVRGIHVNDLDLGGKSLEEARRALELWAQKRSEARVNLHFAPDSSLSGTWKPSAAELGLGVDVAATLDAANRKGRTGVVDQIKNILTAPPTVVIAAIPMTDDHKLHLYLDGEIAKVTNRKPRDAQFLLLRGGGFGTHRDRPGLKLDIEASSAAVKQAWTAYLGAAPTTTPAPSGDTPHPAPDGELDALLTTSVVQASITQADVEKIDGVLGAKSSYVNGTPARLGNIRIAASHINGTLLRPGQIFSYNRVVGPRDEDSGYREAPILIEGRHETGVAGGICQTSGTLFNAVLKSGLKIVRRSHHSAPIGYLPLGLDATVSYGSLDFKFQNDTDAPVYIAATMHGRELTFTLFGKSDPGREVSLVRGTFARTPATFVTHSDPGKPAGYRHVEQPASGGCRVVWYRIVKNDGKVVQRDVIRSVYSPHPGVVVVGTGAASAPKVSKSKPAAETSGGIAPPSGQ